MRRLALAVVFLAGCPSWYGLTVLDALPPEFPVTPVGEPGNVTVSAPSDDGRVGTAVDLAFDEEEQARAGYDAVRAELLSEGWTEAGPLVDAEGASFSRGAETVELSCCRARADRSKLVFVVWRHSP
jgi:hypothetical protein